MPFVAPLQHSPSRGQQRLPAEDKGTLVWLRASLGAVVLVAGVGCARVPATQQRLVSKPNMEFQDRGPFQYGPRVNAQLEPGSADNGGASAAGCTACK